LAARQPEGEIYLGGPGGWRQWEVSREGCAKGHVSMFQSPQAGDLPGWRRELGLTESDMRNQCLCSCLLPEHGTLRA